jgi:hypothetical protein
MFAADGSIGTHDGGVHITQGGVDPLEGGFAHRSHAGTGLYSLVGASGVGHAGKTMQSVSDDLAVGTDTALGKGRECLAGEPADPAELYADRFALRRGLDRGNERCLAHRPSPALAARAFAAEISVIHFNSSGQLLAGIPLHHDLFELVLDLPSDRLSYAESPAKFDAGNALFALGQVIHGAKPGQQSQFGCGKDRFGGRRGLPPAFGALKQVARAHYTMCMSTAGRTLEPLRPSRRNNQRAALLFGAVEPRKLRLTETFLELNGIPSHELPRQTTLMFMVCIIISPAEERA